MATLAQSNPAPGSARASQRASTADKVKQDQDDGDHEKNVEKTAQGRGSHEPEEPKYKENNRNRIEHGITFPELTGSRNGSYKKQNQNNNQ
jgi:hypothetical protein